MILISEKVIDAPYQYDFLVRRANSTPAVDQKTA